MRKQNLKIIIFLTSFVIILFFCFFLKKSILKTELDKIVGIVNDIPIYTEEFKMIMDKNRAEVASFYPNNKIDKTFWITKIDRVTPLEKLHEITIQDCVKSKIIQSIASSYKIDKIKDFNEFKKEWEDFNKEQETAKNKGKIIYGKVNFDLYEYYQYKYTNLVKRSQTIFNQQLDITEEEMKNYYNKMKDKEYRLKHQIDCYTITFPYLNNMGKIDKKQKSIQYKRAENIIKKIRGGEKISALKKKYKKNIIVERLKLSDKNTQIGKMSTMKQRWETAISLSEKEVSEPFDIAGAIMLVYCITHQENSYLDFYQLKNEIYMKIQQQKWKDKINREVENADIEIINSVLKTIVPY